MRWTDAQHDFLRSTADIALFSGANQVGKTIIIAADIAMFLEGRHPYDQTHAPPVKVLFAGHTWAEMAGTLEKLWGMIDKRRFKETIRFEGGSLKGQKIAVYDVISGPGKGSQLIIATYAQGAKRISGMTIHRLLGDEPLTKHFFGEAVPRLLRFGGHMRIGLTPTLDTYAALDWLWKLVDDGVIEEHRVELTVANVTPRGGLVETPWISAGDIELFESRCLPAEVEMRMGRSRYAVAGARVIGRFSPANISEELPPGGARVTVSLDHSKRPGREVATILVDAKVKGAHRVWVTSVAATAKHGTPVEFARAIQTALRDDLGITVADVDYWIGDRAAVSGTGRWDNQTVIDAFREILGDPLPEHLLAMETPYKYQGSATDGWRLINAMCAEGHILIHPRCTTLINSLRVWEGLASAPEKDVLDALRYGIVLAIKSEYTKQRPEVRFR